jgi:outer membrane protein TolC
MFTRSALIAPLLCLTLLCGGLTQAQAQASANPSANPSASVNDPAAPLRGPLPVSGTDSVDGPAPANVVKGPRSAGTGKPLSPALPSITLPATTNNMPSEVDGAEGDPNAPKIFGGDEQIVIKKPRLEALVSVSRSLNPYALDSDKAQGITLSDVLKTCIARNLDISIAGLDTRIGKSNFWGAKGKFLPDVNMGYNYQYLKGKAGIPIGNSGVGPISFDTPFIIASAAFTYHLYRGGSILYGALQKSNQYKAAKYAQRTTISDALLNTSRLYYDLVLNEALLQIRIRAVDVSKAQRQVSQNLVQSGRGTNLDLFQSETQLSSDTQNLIDQQIARRVAAIRLSDFLNVDQGTDLIPVDTVIATKRLMSDNMTVPHLVGLAVANRPELKDRNEQALAAKKQIVIASAPLQPKLDFAGTAYGIGQTISKSTTTDYIFNPNGNGQVLTEHGQRQLANLYTIGLNATWKFGALGMPDIANIYTAKLQTRQAYLQLDRERNLVIDQARVAYLTSLSAARKLEEANKQVKSATEELRLSRLRFENGLSKNIDVLRAQQDYTNALIIKAQAIINYNIAQAQLVHDVGLTSLETLTRSLPEGT